MPEELENKLLSCSSLRCANPLVKVPLWLHMDEEYIRISGEEQISLACQIVSLYHNGPDCRAPLDDGWDQDTFEIETKAAEHMLAEESDDGSEFELE